MRARGAAGSGLALAVMFAGSGCFTVGTEQPSLLQQRVGASEMSPAELRTRVRDLAGRYSGELELLADELAARTADPRLRLSLLRFKIEAIPQMQSALFQPDPLAALVDAWAFVVQLEDALEEIAARGAVDADKLALVEERFGTMKAGLEAIWIQLTGNADVSVIAGLVEEWAVEHPLRALATRESTVGLLAELTGRGGVSPLGAAAFLLQDTQDIARRMEVLGNWLPRQARWQAELFLREGLVDPSLLQSGETPQELAEMVARLLATAEELPGLVAAERAAIFGGVEHERIAFQEFAAGEREALLDAVREERSAVMAQSEMVGDNLVDRAFERATELADRVLLRLLLLFVIAGLAAVAVALVLVRGRRDHRALVVTRRSDVPR